MRKAIKPFATEYRGRKQAGAPKSGARFDDADLFAGDEKPPKDVHEDRFVGGDGYDAALRAADAVFSRRRETAKDTVVEAGEPASAETGPPKRILADLSYRDPMEERLAAAYTVRRGRRLGSKNRPKAAATASEPTNGTNALIPSNGALTQMPKVVRRPNAGYREMKAAEKALKPGQRWKVRAGSLRGRKS